jgi:hypothetical protein
MGQTEPAAAAGAVTMQPNVICTDSLAVGLMEGSGVGQARWAYIYAWS